MKQGEECQLCIDALNVGCEKFDKKYCDLKERYMTDPNMGADDVVMEMTLFATPEERQTLADALVERGMATRPS